MKKLLGAVTLVGTLSMTLLSGTSLGCDAGPPQLANPSGICFIGQQWNVLSPIIIASNIEIGPNENPHYLWWITANWQNDGGGWQFVSWGPWHFAFLQYVTFFGSGPFEELFTYWRDWRDPNNPWNGSSECGSITSGPGIACGASPIGTSCTCADEIPLVPNVRYASQIWWSLCCNGTCGDLQPLDYEFCQ